MKSGYVGSQGNVSIQYIAASISVLHEWRPGKLDLSPHLEVLEDPERSCPPLLGDAKRLKQVLINLLDNAIRVFN
jgi:signal transduction histidine kinase